MDTTIALSHKYTTSCNWRTPVSGIGQALTHIFWALNSRKVPRHEDTLFDILRARILLSHKARARDQFVLQTAIVVPSEFDRLLIEECVEYFRQHFQMFAVHIDRIDEWTADYLKCQITTPSHSRYVPRAPYLRHLLCLRDDLSVFSHRMRNDHRRVDEFIGYVRCSEAAMLIPCSRLPLDVVLIKPIKGGPPIPHTIHPDLQDMPFTHVHARFPLLQLLTSNHDTHLSCLVRDPDRWWLIRSDTPTPFELSEFFFDIDLRCAPAEVPPNPLPVSDLYQWFSERSVVCRVYDRISDLCIFQYRFDIINN